MAAKLLAGKVALVTGSTSGIGAAIARSLGGAGAHLVVHGLIKDEAERAAIKSSFEKELGVPVSWQGWSASRPLGGGLWKPGNRV